MTKNQELIKKLYSENKIHQIQVGSAKVWYFVQRKGHGNLSEIEATKLILNDGVKYNDLLAGFLILGIDGQ
jgi:hypothetical protein